MFQENKPKKTKLMLFFWRNVLKGREKERERKIPKEYTQIQANTMHMQ